MAKDASAGIWLVHKRNLYRYSKESNYKKHKQYTFDQEIKVIYTDLDNNIWVSLGQEGKNKAKLYVIANGDKQKPKLLLSLNTNINYIAQNEHKIVYLGTENGLYQYNFKTKNLYFLKKTAKLNVRSIFIDRDKKTWITTYEQGFFLYTNTTLYTFPKDQNQYLNSSHCIIEDKKGFFWISTNKGLFQASKKSLLQYTQDKKTILYYHFYNKTNGFLTNEFNGGCQPCGNYLENDFITFPSMNGMVFFNPNTIKPILPDKTLFIDEVIIDHKSTHFKDTIVLQNNFDRVTFFIDSPYYGNPYNLNLEAKLKGINKSLWEKVGSNKRISYTALPPGEYTLVVRHLSGFNSKYQYKKITLLVLAAFYQTLWFKTIMYFIGLAIILYLSRIRFLYIKKKNKQLEKIIITRTEKLANAITALELSKTNLTQEILQQKRLIETISHDIKSPLKYLVLTIHHLYKEIDKKRNNIPLKEEAQSAYKSSFHLYLYVENLVKYSKIYREDKKLEENSYPLYELVAVEIQLFEKMALSENTVLINSVNRKESLRTNKKIVSIIMHNLLDNALKNTKNGIIEIRSETKGSKLSFSIKDNGIGMSPELIDYYMTIFKKQSLKKEISRNHGQGFPMIMELIGVIKGDIKITSELNSGTTIEVIINTN
jgi:signal transduction histidine kinase